MMVQVWVQNSAGPGEVQFRKPRGNTVAHMVERKGNITSPWPSGITMTYITGGYADRAPEFGQLGQFVDHPARSSPQVADALANT